MRRSLLVATIALGLLPCFASAQTVDWSTAFRFRTTGGFENPATLVAFNPQPEPPAYLIPPEIDLGEPTQLRITIPDIAVSGGGAQIIFAVPEEFTILAEGEPSGDSFAFQTLGQGVQDVQFNMFTDSGGTPAPGSWVAFNPQPEPPAGWIGMGFNFQFTSNSPATLLIQILDDGVESLSFELIAAADFNSDGDVDQGDLKTWQDNFGSSAAGDANLNGLTDGDDYLIWQRQYTGAEGIATIPEPSSLATLLSGLTALLLIRKRKGERCDSPGKKTLEAP